MTYQEIKAALEETGLPVVYHAWEIGQAPELPYIVFTYPNNSDFMAENSNYVEIVALDVELYTKRKNIALERQVETVLKKYFQYDKSSMWIEDEQMNETLYQTEVVING